MFGIFKRKTRIEQLQGKYNKLMKEAYNLSHINRTKSDQKYAEAEEIIKSIESLKQGEDTE